MSVDIDFSVASTPEQFNEITLICRTLPRKEAEIVVKDKLCNLYGWDQSVIESMKIFHRLGWDGGSESCGFSGTITFTTETDAMLWKLTYGGEQ